MEQRIYARLNQIIEFEDVHSLPKWIRRIVESGDDEQVLRVVGYLNHTSSSPRLGKIAMAHRDLKTVSANQSTFVEADKRYILTENNPTDSFNL